MEYNSVGVYLETKKELRDKIAALDEIISALETATLNAAGNMDVEEFSIDTGQNRIRTRYRDVNQILAGIQAYERMKQMYLNRLNGRVAQAMDIKNFNPFY